MPKARDIMTTPVHTLTKDETLVEAAKQLARHDIGSMPVMDGDRCCGILTDRDIVVAGLAKGKDPERTTVGDIATSKVITVDVDDDAKDVADKMGDEQIRRAPVTEKGTIVGMIAQADIAQALERESAEMLEKISDK